MIKKGFSIVELLLYMGLVSVILVVLGTVFSDLINLQLSSKATSSVEQDSRFILSRLAYDIRRAQSVSTPPSAGTSGSSLSLVIAGVTYTYSQVGTDLTISTSNGSANLNSNDSLVEDFQVTRLGNVSGKPSLRVSFTLTSLDTDLGDLTQTSSYQTTVTLRQ